MYLRLFRLVRGSREVLGLHHRRCGPRAGVRRGGVVLGDAAVTWLIAIIGGFAGAMGAGLVLLVGLFAIWPRFKEDR